MPRALPFVLLAATAVAQTPARLARPADLPLRAAAARVLERALEHEGDGLAAERLRGAALSAVVHLPAGSAAHSRARAIAASDDDVEGLRLAAADLAADLRFRPVAEADLPEGVPGFLALDELEIRAYPSYRMVRASMQRGSMVAFMPLLRHIQEREIAMTTPVQVDYDPARDRPATMAFLYGSPELGPEGTFGRTEVVDVPATTVLTVGSRGYDRQDRLTELRARLDAWLDASDEWRAAGPLRVMSYNSPSVGGDRRYFEVQLPIEPRQPAPARDVRESI